jgi:membrane associated rhomboid family serine protease
LYSTPLYLNTFFKPISNLVFEKSLYLLIAFTCYKSSNKKGITKLRDTCTCFVIWICAYFFPADIYLITLRRMEWLMDQVAVQQYSYFHHKSFSIHLTFLLCREWVRALLHVLVHLSVWSIHEYLPKLE